MTSSGVRPPPDGGTATPARTVSPSRRPPGDDGPEHLDVLVVGAGLSGIGAAHHLQSACPWASYAIFEARPALGGTWDLFRYPGVRSDSDMFTLGYSFRPWEGEKSIVGGDDIRRYIEDVATGDGIDAHIRFDHRIVRAAWSSADARWHVAAQRLDTGDEMEVTCSFLFSCTGYYRYDHGHRPPFAGLDRFSGTVVHPQQWTPNIEYADKRVVVIGSGATAVTLAPALAASAAHVTVLQRSPGYIVTQPSADPVTRMLRRWLPAHLAGPVVRWMKALTTQAFYQLSRSRPELVKRMLRKQLERQLPTGYDIDTNFTPRYDPWDQRLCVTPDGEFFAAIRSGRLDVVTDEVDTFTEGGILLASGRELPADLVITATGLELLFLGGIELTVDGEPVDPAGKLTYKGMMLEDVPNLALAIGYTNASWTLKCDLTSDYVCRLLNYMRAVGIRKCVPVNRDRSVVARPLLGLHSGYIERAVDRFPKQGSAFPWHLHQSYLRDYLTTRRRSLDDGVLVFSRE
jgi:cation diffusion facilitator CzcD-associated flavoprotein CzcO